MTLGSYFVCRDHPELHYTEFKPCAFCDKPTVRRSWRMYHQLKKQERREMSTERKKRSRSPTYSLESLP